MDLRIPQTMGNGAKSLQNNAASNSWIRFPGFPQPLKLLLTVFLMVTCNGEELETSKSTPWRSPQLTITDGGTITGGKSISKDFVEKNVEHFIGTAASFFSLFLVL